MTWLKPNIKAAISYLYRVGNKEVKPWKQNVNTKQKQMESWAQINVEFFCFSKLIVYLIIFVMSLYIFRRVT